MLKKYELQYIGSKVKQVTCFIRVTDDYQMWIYNGDMTVQAPEAEPPFLDPPHKEAPPGHKWTYAKVI